MNGAVKIVIGLLLIVVGVYSYVAYGPFREQLINLIKLALWNWGLLVVFIGLIFLLLGFSELKG